MNVKLKILGTSDLHGYLYPHKYSDNSNDTIGIVNLLPTINQARAKYENVLLLDNGDTIQGSPLTYYHNKYRNDSIHFMSDIMNQIGYDVVNIGNHEFNYGLEYLLSYTNNLNCPVVCANILREGKPAFKDYVIKEYSNGLRVAITGVITHYVPHWEQPVNIQSLQFMDAFDVLKDKVAYIRDHERVDFLIALYHGGFEKDIDSGVDTEVNTGENQGYKMLSEIDGIDLLMTGHQHRTIAYNDMDGTSILQPTCNGAEIGSLEVEFKKTVNGFVVRNKVAEIVSPMDVNNDIMLLNKVNSLEADLQDWLDIPIGKLEEGDLLIEDLHEARIHKHDIVQFINDVQLDISGADISLNALANQVTGFNNEITYRDIISTYIYPNTLSVLRIDGKTLKMALHKNVQYFDLEDGNIIVRKKYNYPKPQHYNYDMYDGISYDIIVDSKECSVENIRFHNKLIEDTDSFTLVMNNYRAAGGGEFTMFVGLEVTTEIQKDMVEIIADYIMKKKVINVVNANNIRVIKK
jgi:5'-nucleotidase/2',3'-cyclic-nucleotide 2'-phosphodiesterase/3'-nucleotidase